jgi:hypothetical protein
MWFRPLFLRLNLVFLSKNLPPVEMFFRCPANPCRWQAISESFSATDY